MLIRRGEARDFAADRRLACTLAAVAGALNAAGFHAVGLFSANMTGNISALSDHMALGQMGFAWFFASLILAFVSGATLSSLAINAGTRRGLHGVYALCIALEAVLLALLGLADLWLAGVHSGPALVVSLSFLMGLQNAVVTQISGARVRTTHISGMATDIGIELGLLIDIARGREPRSAASANLAKLRLHGQTVLSFLAGGVGGVLIYQAVGGLLLLAAAAALFAIALAALIGVRRRPGSAPAPPC